MRSINLFGAAILALSTSAYSYGAAAQAAPATPPADTSTPAPADAPAPDAKPAPKKPMHHKMMKSTAGKGKLAPTKAGDKAVEDLNDASLQAAKDNKPFTPPPTPEAAKKEAHTGDKPMHMKHMKKMTKKAAPKSDAAAPATDAAPPADAPK